MLILESSVATLLFMPGGLAIALETLSDLIIGVDKLKLAPIKNPTLADQVRKECKEVIEKYSEEIGEEGLSVLIGKISQINQQTNKERLKAPFIKLGIDLSGEDLQILKARNDFLHGRICDVKDLGTSRSIDRKNKDMFYASMRFLTLLNMLILKSIGYDNYVLNYPKIYEDYCEVKLKEEFYRKL
jgi:hypothetical protein